MQQKIILINNKFKLLTQVPLINNKLALKKKILNIKNIVNRNKILAKRIWRKKNIIPSKRNKKFLNFNIKIKKEFKLKKKRFFFKNLTKKKVKMLKTINLNYSETLLLLSLSMQNYLRKVFLFRFYVKFNQTLHRIISTKRLISSKGRSNIYLLNWNLRKFARIKNIVRTAFSINKFRKINLIMQIMQQLFQKKHRNKKPFFELFRILMKINKPKSIEKSRLVFRGKKDKKSRTKTMVMGNKYQEINKFSSAHYHRRINFVCKYGNEKAGSFSLKILIDSGNWNDSYELNEKKK